jgi:hypothetical protein
MDIVHLLLLAMVIFTIHLFYKRMRPRVSEGHLDAFQKKHGLKLDYNYRNILGIDTTSNKIYIYTDAARIFDVSDIRELARSNDTRTDAVWNVRSYSNCSLTFTTNDLEQPIYVVQFKREHEEMEKWYARLSMVCHLS